jgi:tetratricopeptide (TPR) repeat protein
VVPRSDLPPRPSTGHWLRRAVRSAQRAARSVRSYLSDQDPTFWVALTPALVVAALLFVRSPTSNYIFDEQEALLANPYVNGHELRFIDAIRRDFWGLPPDRSIGSYRPIPNFIWRILWHVSSQPFLHHWVNVIGHAVNAALIAALAFRISQSRRIGWLAGGYFVVCATITEAVTGVVGIADVLGGLGVLLAIAALALPLWAMPLGVFFALSFGLFSKESAIVGVPLVGWSALVTAPCLRERPLRVLRAVVALLAATLALVTYTEFRRHFFPVELPSDLAQALPPGTNLSRRALHAFLRWFHQPALPSDPINNPLVEARLPQRIAGALRVFARGLGQLLWPWDLSGDYSYRQEPIPTRLVFPGSIIGGLAFVVLPLTALAAWVASLRSEARTRREAKRRRAQAEFYGFGPENARVDGHGAAPLVALGALWLPVAYFPHSNLSVLLPTVRAERFWYLPAVGAALLLAVILDRLLRVRTRAIGLRVVMAFFAVQALRSRAHALDYTDDLAFWDSTRKAAPYSAKAHLNYSVMVGARGRLEDRLEANRRALELAPSWPMANVYYGDTLCRMKKPELAWPHYRKGFELSPNDPNLIALGLQCMWDQNAVENRKAELLEIAGHHPGSWLSLLSTELVYYGKENNGVQQKYRPRSYNEGPKSN